MLKKIIANLLYLLIFLLPWQTAYIWRAQTLNGVKWEYGSFLLFGTELLLWLIIILQLIVWAEERKFSIFNFQFSKLFFILFLLWSGLSIIWSSDKALASYYFLHLAESAIFGWLIFTNKLKLEKISWALVSAGAVQAGLAVCQFLTQMVLANKWLGITAHSGQDLGAAVIQQGIYRWLRAYGGFSHPNILGGFLAVSFASALYLYFHSTSGRKKILSAGALVMIFAGLFFSFSRSAWLATALVYGAWLGMGRWLKIKAIDLIKISIFLLLIFSVLFCVFQPLAMARVKGEGRLEIKSIEQRLGGLKEARDLIKENWLLGAGLGNYTFALSQKNPGQPAWAYQPVHNLFALIFAELGAVGIIAFFLFFFFSFLKAIKSWRQHPLGLSLAIVFLIVGLLDHYLWTGFFGLMLSGLILALITVE